MERIREAPIGVFDSGMGGLTVLRELLRELPDERYFYVADAGNCPYGVRSVAQIQRLSLRVAGFLVERGAKLIVVACNTVSVNARTELREAFPDVPFVVVVPAVKPAAALTRTGRVGVAATEASARGHYLETLIREHAQGVRVLAAGCPDLVRLVEAGRLDGPEVEATIRGYIQPMLDAGIDVLVLGCTHFPAQRAAFARVVGPHVALLDSGAAIARQVRRLLERDDLLAASRGDPRDRPRAIADGDAFWTTGDVGTFARVGTALLGQTVQAHYVPGMLLPPEAD